ncbi:MAG: hypothetical protein HY908_09770 [Myxococcales bacterium]|nr:hypothetical protein [Myxococcales bacterium]
MTALTNHFSGEKLRAFMDEFKTPDGLRSGVMDLISDLRHLGRFSDLGDAASSLLIRIQDGKLASAEDLARLSRLFRTARLDEIDAFLAAEDVSLDDFEKSIRSRKFTESAGELIAALELREGAHVGYSDVERKNLMKLKTVLNEQLPADAA